MSTENEPVVTLASTTETQDELDHATSPNWREQFDPEKAKTERVQREKDAAAEEAKTKAGGQAPPAARGPEGESESDDDDTPLPKGVQRRLDKLTHRLKLAESKLEEKEKAKVTETPVVSDVKEDKEPQKKDFADSDDWVRAHGLWAAREVSRQNVAATAQKAEEAHSTEVFQAHLGRLDAFRGEHPDFDKTIETATIPFSQAVAIALVEADNGPAIAYHLAKHPDEFEKLSKMSQHRQIMEIGRISASLSPSDGSAAQVTPTATRSKTPAPITPEKTTKAAAANVPLSELGTDDFIKRRDEEERAKRRR